MSQFGFDKMLKKMNSLKQTLPRQVGNMGQRFFVDSFTKQGWTDASFEHWKERKDKKNTRPLLVGKSGGTSGASHTHLRQSVNTSLKKAEWNDILFSVPQPYAKIQNEGGTITIPASQRVIHFKKKKGNKIRFSKASKANYASKVSVSSYKITIPARKYIGNSKTLIKNIRVKIDTEMVKVLKAR